MKYDYKTIGNLCTDVALYMRAWIEVLFFIHFLGTIHHVALYMRAWIEVLLSYNIRLCLPVALYMRAWIEV